MRRFLPLLFSFGLVLLLAGCHEDPYLTVSPSSLSFAEEGGSQTIQVSANYAWTASVSGSGFKISPASGEGVGSVTVTASAATSADEITGSVSFQSEGLTASVALKQSAKTMLEVGSVTKIPQEGGTVTVDVRYNTEFMVEIESAAQSWISYAGTKSLNSGKLTFEVKSNETTNPRTGKVTVKDKSRKVQPQTLTFEQEEKKVIQVGETTAIPYQGGTSTVDIKYNTAKADISVEVENSAKTWITFIQTKALQSGTLEFKFAANKGDERTGKVTVKDKNGKADPVTITFTQMGIPEYMIKERAALVAFYKANDGDHWVNKDNWCTDDPVGTWYGVTTDASGHVKDITFWGNHLKGYLPDEIADLTELEGLNLTENEPATSGYKPLPAAIGKLKHLKKLYLQGYALSGKFPASLFDLESLEELYFNNAMFTDPQPIPADIQKLKNLRVLGMNNMNLTGTLIPELGTLFNLETLRLNQNHLTGGIPESFGNLKNLSFFEAYSNQLSGVFPTSFGMLDNYWKLWPGLYNDNRFTMEDMIASKIPAPKSPKVKTISGKTLDLEAEFRKNQYTVLFSVAPEYDYAMSVEYLTTLERFYKLTRDKGLGVITYLDNEAEISDQKTWDEHFKQALKESGAEWESFIRYSLYDYPEGEAPFYSEWGTQAYPFSGANQLVIIGPENTLVYATIMDSSGYGKIIDNAISYLEKQFGTPIERYESKDFTADGKVKTLQTASKGAGIDLVITGDAYSDRLIADGTFEKMARNAAENLFSVEPYKSLRDRFNVYLVNAVSKNEEFFNGSQTVFSGDFGGGSAVGGDNAKVLQYAGKAVSASRMDNVTVLVLMNTSKTGGTCYMNDPEDSSIYAGGSSVVWVPYNDANAVNGNSAVANRVVHELGGHGIAKLADEYYYIQYGKISGGEVTAAKNKQKIGWYMNVDFTGDPAKVLWSQFIGDKNYSSEQIGAYEGGFTYFSGVWRPTEQSVMFSDYDHPTFNAPSRAQIYTRIMKLSEGNSWTFNYDEFVKWDKAHPDTVKYTKSSVPADGEESIHVAPIASGKTWRQVMER